MKTSTKILFANLCQSVAKLLLTVLLVMSTSFPVVAQSQSENHTFGDSVNELVSFFAPFIFPKVIQDVYQLRAFITSEELADIRIARGDLSATDAIFAEAMRISFNNAYEALLIAFVATMDHRKFGVNLPVVGPLLWFPLTSEFEHEYRARIRALPSQLYPDSPQSEAGDRDKLQHFFGSAFLAYTFESRDASQRVGECIEWGEDKVIVDGALDDRDFRANTHGQDFGLRLLDDKHARPSVFLKFSIVERRVQELMHRNPSSMPDGKGMEKP